MTSEAGRRPLHARLAISGTAKQATSKRGKSASGTRARPKAAAGSTNGMAATNGTAASNFGHDTNGHGTNAHGTNAHGTNAHGTNGHDTYGQRKRGATSQPNDPELTVIAPAAPPAAQASRATTHDDDPLAALLAEAQAAISDGANALRDVRERYRAAYNERVEQLEAMRGWPTAAPGPLAARTNAGKSTNGAGGNAAGNAGGDAAGNAGGNAAGNAGGDGRGNAASNAGGNAGGNAVGNGGSGRGASGQAVTGHDVGQERGVLNRIDLAAKSLENAWLFLAREDSSLVNDPSGPPSAADAQMRIVEAQEQERTRLAREVHDGPAQALSNAIFQVEVVQRLLDRDEQMARAELQQLRDVLTRELRGVRAYLSQLRPPLLADLGLSGAIREAANQTEQALNIPVAVELAEAIDNLPETIEVVALRVIQEALQNARKHAQASSIRVRMSRDGNAWAVEVRDDGKGFDADVPPVSGRRHFGLQFMRERAELIGARFEVRSSPNLGTAVRMTIPPGAMGMAIPEGEV